MTTRNSPKKRSMSLLDLLATEDKGVGEPKGVSGIFANLWRQVMYRENITPSRWQRALNMWTDRQMAMAKRSGVKVKKSSLTGNISKELVSRLMTVKVFIKACQIYGARKIEISVKVTWGNGSEGVYTINEDTNDQTTDHIAEAVKYEETEDAQLGELTKGVEDVTIL